MPRFSFSLAFNSIILILFALYPMFMTLHYIFVPESYDFFHMDPLSLVYIPLFYIILGFLIAMYGLKRRFLFYTVLFFPLLFYAINYPNLIFRDAYLHGRWVKTIVNSGDINNLTDEGKAWPSSYIVMGVCSIITGVEILYLNTPLALLIFSLFVISCYCLAKRMRSNVEKAKVDDKMYLLTPFIAIAFMRSHIYEPLHFARHPFGFSLLLLLIFLLWRYQNERRWNNSLTLLLTIAALITVHPLFSIYGVVTIILNCVINALQSKFGKENRELPRPSLIMPILATVMFVGWLMFSAGFALPKLQILMSYALNPRTLSETASLITFNVNEEIPWYGFVMRQCYKLLLLILAGLSILSFFSREIRKSPSFAFLLAIIVILPIQKSIGYIGGGILNRAYTFLAIAFSFLIPAGVQNVSKTLGFLRLKKQPKLVSVIKRILVATFICTALISTNILSFEYNFYTGLMKLDSTAAISNFITTKNTMLNITARNFALYYVYFNPNASPVLLPSLSASKDAGIENEVMRGIFSNDLFVLTVHEYGEKLGFASSLKETLYFWQDVERKIEQTTNISKIYDCKLGSIYLNLGAH